MDIKLSNLNKTIINCKKCPRLVKFVSKVSIIKRKQNINLGHFLQFTIVLFKLCNLIFIMKFLLKLKKFHINYYN